MTKNRLLALLLAISTIFTLCLYGCEGEGSGGEITSSTQSGGTSQSAATLLSIILDVSDVKTQFEQGETFTYNGLKVAAVMSDGTKPSVPLSACTVTPPDMNERGERSVRVSYQGKRASYAITIGGVDAPQYLYTVEYSGVYRFEAEDFDTTYYVRSSANDYDVVARADASGGKFLAAATGDCNASQYFEFFIDLKFPAKLTMTAAYSQTEKWKGYDEEIAKTYLYIIDENRNVGISGDPILYARDDITVWSRFTYNEITLPEGKHSFRGRVAENTAKGNPNIDYLEFSIERVSSAGEGEEEQTPANDFHTKLQYDYINDNYANVFNYVSGAIENSFPTPVSLQFENDDINSSTFVLEYAFNAQFENSKKVSGLTEKSYGVYNFKLGQEVFYRAAATEAGLSSAPVHRIVIADKGPRNLYIPGVTNARDIGGYDSSLTPGAKIRQGLYFRSAKLDDITAEGKLVLTRDLGVKVEIDMRDLNQCNGPYVDGVEYNAISVPSGTESTRFEQFESEYRLIFALIANADQKPVILHCTAGCDRTGIVTMMLLTVCGASYEDVARDYLFSNFSTQGQRRLESEFVNWWNKLDSFSGSTKAEKAKSWLLSKGISETTVQKIRSIFVEGYDPDYFGGEGESEEQPTSNGTINAQTYGTYLLEAETVDITHHKRSSDNASDVVARADASGGKFLAAATGNPSSSQYFEFGFVLGKDSDVTMTAAYAQTANKKGYDEDMTKTYAYTFYKVVNGTQSAVLTLTVKGNASGSKVLSARSDETVWEEFTYNTEALSAGSYVVRVTVIENTNGKGNPNVDYMRFVVAERTSAVPVDRDIITVSDYGAYRFEAENASAAHHVISSDNPDKVVERSDASCGKFLAAATGNPSSSQYFEFRLDLEVDADVTMTASYVQTAKKKGNDQDMTKTYAYTFYKVVNGALSESVTLTVNGNASGSKTLAARSDETAWEEFTYNTVYLEAGSYVIRVRVVENTNGKGNPNVDYLDFDVSAHV